MLPAPAPHARPSQSPPGKRTLRFPFLDGLRGLASLYVLLFHASTPKIVGHGEPSRAMAILRGVLGYGHFGVVFFIVLSGFSLMLPIARSGSFEMQGGFGHYLSRRARRILPPYYVALVLSIGLIAAYNAIAARRGLVAPVDSALTPGAIGSHLLLFHNLTWDWAYRINGPMWSVATEWQIYFLFPAILLPLCRGRGGVFVTVGVAWLLGSLPQIFLPAEASFFWACPWFIGSFALGMMVAVIGCSPQFRESPWRKQVPWGTLTLLFLGVLVVLTATGRAERWPLLVVDIFVSAFAACWIGACVNRAEADAESFMLRILGSRPMVALAGFSYSLYLVQHPILRFSEKVVDRLPLRFDANIGVHLLVVAPLIMAIAWLFSELFEKPFTTGGLLFRSRVRAASMAAPQLT